MAKDWVLALDSQDKGSLTSPSLRVESMDQESWGPVGTLPWLGSVLWVSFNALTLVIDWQEGHPACKNTTTTTGRQSGSEWRLGLVVAHWSQTTKLLYAGGG